MAVPARGFAVVDRFLTGQPPHPRPRCRSRPGTAPSGSARPTSRAAAASAVVAAAAVVGARSVAGRRPARKRIARRVLTDDLVLAADEALSTLEDAALHAARFAPWIAPASDDGQGAADEPSGGKRRVVILGSGWAAHAITKVIDVNANDVTVVSPRNYFIFTPMLAGASVGSVEYRSILEHIRSANPTLKFIKGFCEAVDVAEHTISVSPVADTAGSSGSGAPSLALPYDVLVVAVGVRPSSQGVPGVTEHCLFLKEVEDARAIRKRVTECFELADMPGASPEEQQRLLTFVVVGGGPTGCEFCGELSDFVRNDLRRFYPKLAPKVRIVLLHRGAAILSSFGEEMQAAARTTLESQGIEVITSTAVSNVGKEALTVNRKGSTEDDSAQIPYGLCVWAAGQGSREITDDLRSQIPRQQELSDSLGKGPLYVDEWLRVEGVDDGSVVALGDCARIEKMRRPLPLTAQVAAQQGAYVARLLNRRYFLGPADAAPRLAEDADALLQARAFLFNQADAPTFRFLDLGRLAYLGEEQAVAEVSLGNTAVSQASGRAAFALWRSVYMVKQVSFRNRVLVAFDWIKSRVFGRDLTRF